MAIEEADGKSWFYDIKTYIQKNEYPEGVASNDRKTIRRLAMGFFSDGKVLYKRNHDMTLLRCVEAKEVRQVMREVHKGVCGTHAGGHSLAQKILKSKYYWMTMERDCIDYTQKCHKCQVYGDRIQVPPAPLHVEVASYSSVTQDIFKVRHHNLAPYRPQVNGAVEAANKNIKNILEKMTKTYKDWHDKLPFTLMAYRTTARTSTGATPFSLVYEMEAVIPVEVEIPSLRVLKEAELPEEEWVQSWYDQLNLNEEKKMTAIAHGQLYQRRMIRAFNRKMRPWQFQEGDLVLKKILPIHAEPRGKWTPNYEGPYVLKKAFSRGALLLVDMDRIGLLHPVNSDVVKRYYA
ncbi:uncharacterized protein LOC131163347 [Malania oleifera]|uniref:uncharacterized protein LOC131163347 n=1 Tax=Malania oleifera TaxID=397392 RepID=UPI0025ADB26D|nr:uncharacterized protein LOC131163347 [Malania oleifera]